MLKETQAYLIYKKVLMYHYNNYHPQANDSQGQIPFLRRTRANKLRRDGQQGIYCFCCVARRADCSSVCISPSTRRRSSRSSTPRLTCHAECMQAAPDDVTVNIN